MRRIIIIGAALLSFLSPAYAADSNLVPLTAASALADTDLMYCAQSAGTLDRKCTPLQMAAYVYGKMSGDATASGTGAVTLKNTGPGATGPLGSATVAPIVTIDAQGRVTALSSATVTPAIGSLTGLGAGVATALAIAPGSAGAFVTFGGAAGTPSSITLTNGTGLPFTGVTGRFALSQAPQGIANSIWINPTGSTADMQNVAIPACANDGTHGLVYVNGTGLQCASISGSGAVASVTGGIGVTCSPTTGSVVCNTPATTTNNTGTTDTITSSNKGTIITESNAASIAVSITTAGFVATDYFTVKNLKTLAGVATYTPTSGTIDGAATLVCQPGQSADIVFGGTNYTTLANTCQLGALATVTPGSNVATAAAVALSGAGGLASTIFRGTAVLGTSAIGSGACATVVTVAATNVATTDVVTASYNSDPTAVTGYGASATGAVLSVYPYPTSGNILVKVCNSTGGSITPGAMTVNVSAVR